MSSTNEINSGVELLLWGLMGSIGAHGLGLGLSYLKLWPKVNEAQLSPITLIVMEPTTEPAEESGVLDAVEPAELGSNPTASVPTASAPPAKVAVVTAPDPVPAGLAAVAEPDVSEEGEFTPLSDSEVASEPGRAQATGEAPEEDTPEAQLSSEQVETTQAEADAREPASAADSSQLDRLRNFLQRQ